MKKTLLSTEILSDALNYYDDMKTENFVVSPALPILFFGDIDSYLSQDFKIITVGLNPSNSEFRLKKEETYSFARFPDYSGDEFSLEETLKNYFKELPYRKWFNSLEPFLNGLESSFYPNEKNKVVHTDICSPLPTDPTWNNLDKSIQMNLFRVGFEFWKRLISELKPDVIVLSTRRSYLEKLKPKNRKIVHSINLKKDGSPRRPFHLELFDINVSGFQTKLVYGEPKNTPFGSVTNEDRGLLGRKVLDLLY